VLESLSDNRSTVAAVLIILLLIAFVWSIVTGRKRLAEVEKEAVFGDPERTKGGWYWSVCGISALLLVWFYFSWGAGRAFFPMAANEMCQVAKVDAAMSPIKATLPITSRYYKSTLLVSRNSKQLEKLKVAIPSAFTTDEQSELESIMADTSKLIANSSNEANMRPELAGELEAIASEMDSLSEKLAAGPGDLKPTEEALAQPKWGVSTTEIPILPMTPRGVMFDNIAEEAADIAGRYNKIRNHLPENDELIESIKGRIKSIKDASKVGEFAEEEAEVRDDYVKAVDRIFKRLDDGTIFPASALDKVNASVSNFGEAQNKARGGLRVVDALLLPGEGVVKSKTQCTEQTSARWLPKPTDVVATFMKLANPDLENGGGYRGFTLLWWKWLPVSNVVGFLTPDWIADLVPGDYARHGADGTITPNTKDKVLAFAQGEVDLGHIPMLDGHIWDSLFRVLMALSLGILLGVPLGLFMGISKFFKSFFDPLIELYRPVPPLAWAPLILTIFGIQDDGKIFLLFMVAFAIMVISARTGAIGTQLSKIRAAHSLGSTDRQIMRNVIFPNALPEILTGVRISSDYELIWVTILIMGLLGLLFDLIMRWIINKTIPWRGKG